jgi:PhnB protein
MSNDVAISKVRPVPEGYHTVTPYLICDGASQAIEFYKKAFGAVEVMRMPMPNGRLGHAEIKIGDSFIMLADENPEGGARSPKSYGGSPISVLIYVENTDATAAQAVSAGGKLTRPLKDEFYGDRTATLVDPFGHTWYIHTHIRDVSPEEMKKAMQAAGQ